MIDVIVITGWCLELVLQELMDEKKATEFFTNLGHDEYRRKSLLSVARLIRPQEASLHVDNAAAKYCHENTLCLQFLPSLAAAISCADFEDSEKLKAVCRTQTFSSRIDKLLEQSGLPGILVLADYIQAKRLLPKIQALINAIAKSQRESKINLAIQDTSGKDVQQVLKNARELYNSKRRRKTDYKNRALEKLEVEFKGGDDGQGRILDKKKKIRKAIKEQMTYCDNKASSAASLVAADIRQALARKTIPRGFFLEGGNKKIHNINVQDLIFNDIGFEDHDYIMNNFIREPLEALIDDICNRYKDHVKQRLGAKALENERCAQILQRLNSACEEAKEDIRKWVLDKGTFKSVLNRRPGRGIAQAIKSPKDAMAKAFSNYRKHINDRAQGVRRREDLLDIIANEDDIKRCRQEAVELYFNLFLEKMGSYRQRDLIDVLMSHLDDRALGGNASKKNDREKASHLLLFRKFRNAIDQICTANRETSDQQGDGDQEIPAFEEKLMRVGAGVQHQLESIQADIQALLTGTRTNPIPPQAQYHLAPQVFNRKYEGMVAEFKHKHMHSLKDLYTLEDVHYTDLRKYHSAHAADGCVDALDSPFRPDHYRFMAPRRGIDEDADKAAGKQSDTRNGKRPKKMKGSPADTGKRTSLLLASSDDPLSIGNIAVLKERLAKEGLQLVDQSYTKHWRTLIPDGITFSSGLMGAMAYSLHSDALNIRGDIISHHRSVQRRLEGHNTNPRRLEALHKQLQELNESVSIIDNVVRLPYDVPHLARQLLNMACTSLIDDLIYSESRQARENRSHLQQLLAPIDLLVYLDMVTAGEIGSQPALLYFVSNLYRVNIQIWDGASPNSPPLLLGSQPRGVITLNLIYFPPPALANADPRQDNLYRYGRWAVAKILPRKSPTVHKRPIKKGSSGEWSDYDDDDEQQHGAGGSKKKRLRLPPQTQ